MKLFEIIILFILLYYLLSKYFFPYLLRKFVEKAQEHFSQFQQGNPQPTKRPEGEINVDYVPQGSKEQKGYAQHAEDVDFEEIKEK